MHSADQLVINQISQWLAENIDCWLGTIIATKGASPRPVGSLFCINNKGIISGSVSNGCIEDDIVARLSTGELNQDNPHTLVYGTSAEDNERLGLPCGGELTLLLQPIASTATNRQQFADIVTTMSQRNCIKRTSSTNDNDSYLTSTKSFQPLTHNDSSITHCFGPRFLLVIIGAGQLAKSLSELAIAMDYKVIVCDPRPQAIEHWKQNDCELIFANPDKVIADYSDKQTAIVSLTHVSQIDDLAVTSALQTQAFYIGALGSQRTSNARRERLSTQQIDNKQLQRLHAPVGLNIGSKTPIEIAVSIMAQITSIRNESAA